jgi:hypothetical protein
MKRNLATKRRAFHDTVREHQLQTIFRQTRMRMVEFYERPQLEDMEELIRGLPGTLVELNRTVPLNEQVHNDAL